MENEQSARRCLLFVPGDSLRKLEKSAQLDVDSVILDLEDAVAGSRKAAAREMVSTAVNSFNFGRTERLIRVNAPDSELFAADMEAIASLTVEGLVLPKVETAAHLHHAAHMTDLPLFVLIETAVAVMNLQEIANSTPQLAGLLFGGEDLSADLGALPSADKREIFYARSAVVTAAAAYSLQAIDTVNTEIDNLDGLAAEAQTARRMGYVGKMAIHPNQVHTIQQTFSPTAAEINQAKAIVNAYEAHVATGSGVFTMNGRMVDKPVIRRAGNVLARARAADLLDGKDDTRD